MGEILPTWTIISLQVLHTIDRKYFVAIWTLAIVKKNSNFLDEKAHKNILL